MASTSAVQSTPAVNLTTRPAAPSSQNWTATVAATKGPLSSVIFAIPFPEPGPALRKTSKTPMMMLYSLPRAIYLKPRTINGKKEKEGLIKKAERKWQEEVQEGQDIKAGKLQNPSSWKKFKGGILRAASKAITWLPENNIQTVGRLPPSRKIGLVTIVYPHEDDAYGSAAIDQQPQDIQKGLEEMLARTKRKALLKTTLSGLTLPITLAIDVFCIVPLFIFEINLVYFALQVNGARKITSLSRANAKAKKHVATKAVGSKSGRFGHLKRRFPWKKNQEADLEPQPASPPLPNEPIPGEIFNYQKSRPNVFQPITAYLYSLCSSENPIAFPPQPNGAAVSDFRSDQSLAVGLITSFKEWVPVDVALRHNLTPDVVAKDLRRSMKKSTKAYLRTLKKVRSPK